MSAREWVRAWYAIGGRARCGRRGLIVWDRRYDETVSRPLMNTLTGTPGLREQVKEMIRPPAA